MVELVIFFSAVFIYFIFALWRMEWALVALPLFIPLYLFKLTVLGVPITLVEVFIYVLLMAHVLRWIYYMFTPAKWIASLFAILEDTAGGREKYIKKFWWILLPLFVFVLAGFLSLLVVPKETVLMDGQIFESQKIALGILKGWIVAPVILFLLYLGVIKDNKRILDVLNFYTVSAFILSVWAIFQLSADSFITPDARASGPFENANYLSLYLTPAIFYVMVRGKEVVFPGHSSEKVSFLKILMGKGGHEEARPEASLFFVVLFVMLLALIATKSYGAMIALVAASIFYFGLEYIERWRSREDTLSPWKFIIGGLSLVIVLIMIVSIADSSKWQSMFKFDERNSSSVRLEVYTVATNLIVENWGGGIGLGQFPAYYQLESPRILGHDPYEWNMLHPHNIFYAMWLGMGVMGLIAFLWLIGVAVYRCTSYFGAFTFKKIHESHKLSILGLSMLIITLTHGFFDTPFFKNDLAIIFWIIMMVTILPGANAKRD